MRLGPPVKWIEDRREHLLAANDSREQRHHARAAIDADGYILALEDEFDLDQGAYVRTHGARVAEMTIAMVPGPYRIPAYRSICHFRLTNKTPAATYRAPGRFEGTFVRERLLDAVADRLGLDRVTVRRRNLITASEMPYFRPLNALGTEVVYDSGDYPLLLDKALARIGWVSLQADLHRRRAAGELVGSGIAIFVEKGGLGPLDGTRITVDTTGAVELVTGGSAVGQGFATAMAQICADTLGVDYRRVRVVSGQTDRIQYGIGAHASRASVMTGSATHAAALKVRAKALDMAASLMQASPHEIDVSMCDKAHADAVRKTDGTPKTEGNKLLMAFECKFYESTPGVSLGRTFVGLISDCGGLRFEAFVANLPSEKLGLYFSKKSRPSPFLGLIPTDAEGEDRFIRNVEQELRKWA
jgi:CO/xanthine dehydrogenase Mo-binding subunit